MDGLELASRFSYMTNCLGYCGPKDSHKDFLQYLENKDNKEKLEKDLKKYEALYAYLDGIAKKNGKHFADYDVVESYWIGNGLLDNFTDEDNRGIIRSLVNRGLPKSIGDGLIKRLPKGMVPHHNFHVFYVGVGNVTGHVKTTLENMDRCRIAPGRVIEIRDSMLVVMVKPLSIRKGRLALGDEEPRSAMYMRQMIPAVRIGDVVALHWGFACMKLTDEQHRNLEKYNGYILSRLPDRIYV